VFNSPFAHRNLFSRLHMGVKNDPTSSPFFSESFGATKKLKVSASSTKSQQLRSFKFLFYIVSQIVFLFSLLTQCRRPNSYVSRCCCSAVSLADC